MEHKHDDKIACQVCKKEIPKSAAMTAEGAEYVQYFCDIGCLDYWKDKQDEKAKKKE